MLAKGACGEEAVSQAQAQRVLRHRQFQSPTPDGRVWGVRNATEKLCEMPQLPSRYRR